MRFSRLLTLLILCGFDSLGFAQITGRVMFKGEPPEAKQIAAIDAVGNCAELHKDPVYEDNIVVSDKNEVANVIVFIKPAEGKTLAGPQKQTPAVLDQKGCMYTPHVLAVQVGQPIVAKNSDMLMHNVRAVTMDNEGYNKAMVTVGQMPLKPFTKPEIMVMQCDVHGWMKAVVRIFDHPYFSVSDAEGKFNIDTNGLADGTYTIDAWHEKFGDAATQSVIVKNGKADKELEFTYEKKDLKEAAKP